MQDPHIRNYPLSHSLQQYNEKKQTYLVRSLSWEDSQQQDEYQRLRAAVFVRTLAWQIPIDIYGRERDRYDMLKSQAVQVYGVYGLEGQYETLLGGIRIFTLRTWEDSMVATEFRQANIIPEHVWDDLQSQYNCEHVLELTRFCITPGLSASLQGSFQRSIVRDLLYASAVGQAQETRRPFALALIDASYQRALRRSGFVFQEIYRAKVALIMIDIWATVNSIQERNKEQAKRMTLCCGPDDKTP